MHERHDDFSFATAEIAQVLRNRLRDSLAYVGSATSHFQADPLVLDARGQPVITSDWEIELLKNIEGRSSKISGSQHPANFPHFLKNKDLYIARSAELGENMFRFSLDFARLCPREDQFDTVLMSEYVRILARIRASGLEPMLALYHWPMPKWLLGYDRRGDLTTGGWEHPEAYRHFRFYVDSVLAHLQDEGNVRSALEAEGVRRELQDEILSEGLVHYFLTINEPSLLLMSGYMLGLFPPYKKGDLSRIIRIVGTLADAHAYAFGALKQIKSGQRTRVGIAHNWTYFDGIFGRTAHALLNEKTARLFERTGEASDFIGLQYYFRLTLPSLYHPVGRIRPKGRHYGDHPHFGDVYPRGILEVLKKMHALFPTKNIFITEFGFSDKNDTRRPYWILETVRYVIEAARAGIPVTGLLLWTLASNFEWHLGMGQKFGLFNEFDLEEPLPSRTGKEVRGWEAWRAAANAIRTPSSEKLSELQRHYDLAARQFEYAIMR
jgi:beta-glucosidase